MQWLASLQQLRGMRPICALCARDASKTLLSYVLGETRAFETCLRTVMLIEQQNEKGIDVVTLCSLHPLLVE
ncbi:hypothetical protein VNO78_35035 [Psophocarpus tetragonolobus]|uniref:Uncharacterized protein n=1 Tax=Psophocarpus tetragonolobus TaxID=3891 RepID=A0AAN9NNN0_PSOTE